MNSLAKLTDADLLAGGQRPVRNVPDALVAAVSTALWQMKDAGLADFGQIKDPRSVAEKAVTYAEALLPTAGDPFARRIDAECVFAAADAICRAPSPKVGEETPIPTAGDFRHACLEAWNGIYRHVGVPVLQDGREVHAIAVVRRDASEDEVAATRARTKAKALTEGCKALPAPELASILIAETRKRMHEMLGWEAPGA